MEKRLLTEKEVCAWLGVCFMTIRRMEKKGIFPKRLNITGRAVRWDRLEIEEWLATRPRGQAKGALVCEQ